VVGPPEVKKLPEASSARCDNGNLHPVGLEMPLHGCIDSVSVRPGRRAASWTRT
jgi:hypothetical protein